MKMQEITTQVIKTRSEISEYRDDGHQYVTIEFMCIHNKYQIWS